MVRYLVFILVYPLIWLLSILPFRILYGISDGAYVILYYLIGYRKKTVVENLRLAFPEKSEVEIKKLSKSFYKHFTDIFIEMIKSFTISEKEIMERYKPVNIEVLQDLEQQNKSAILLGAHYANWEWIFNFNLRIGYQGFAIYKKLKNPYFDKKIRDTRGRYNTQLVPTKEIFEVMRSNKQQGILSIYGFLGDQSPKPEKAYHWPYFLGVQVPAYTGVEMLSKKYDLPIVFFKTKKVKRGYYESTLKLLVEKPNEYPDYQITDLFLKEVEQQIKEAPAYYFWTHKRFKHKDKVPRN